MLLQVVQSVPGGALNCLKGQGQKRNIAQPNTTGPVKLPNLASVSSPGGRRWDFLANPRRGAGPLPPPRGFVEVEPGARRAAGCPIVQRWNPGLPGVTPELQPRHPVAPSSANPPPPPARIPLPRSPIVCLASPRPWGHVRLQLPERPGRGAAGGPGGAGDWCRAPSEPRAGAGAVGGGKGGVGRCPSPDKERVGHAEQAAPPAESEGVSAQRAGLSFTCPSPPPRRKGGVSSPPPHQERGAGREAGPSGARPEASAASSRQRGREKERLGRD